MDRNSQSSNNSQRLHTGSVLINTDFTARVIGLFFEDNDSVKQKTKSKKQTDKDRVIQTEKELLAKSLTSGLSPLSHRGTEERKEGS